MELLPKSLDLTLKKRKWVILLALCGVSSYGMYKVYNLPSVSRKRKRFLKSLGALISIAETASDSAEILGVVSRDLKEFLASDTGQIPNSLKQLSKVLASDEFSNSLSRVSEAATMGVIQGYREESSSEIEKTSFKDQVFDKLNSKAGTGFVSIVVGSFARNLVLGFYSNENYESGSKMVSPSSSNFAEWVDLLSEDKSKLVMADFIKNFVGTAVAVYLDRSTTSTNLYDEIFTGLTNHKHQEHIKNMVVHVCNGAVETLVKTSHQVLTSPKSSDFCC